MNKDIFDNMPIDLKGDFVFQKGTFIDTRLYGFLKMVLYEMESFYVEVVYSIENNNIENVNYISVNDVQRLYFKTM